MVSGEKMKVEREKIKVEAKKLLEKIKEIIKEGNARKITILGKDGKVFVQIPLTVGVVATVLLPVWVAVGTLAALVSDVTIVVEKDGKKEKETEKDKKSDGK